MKRFLWAVFLSCLLCTGGATGSMAATPVLTLSDKAPRIEIARHAEYHLDTSGTLRYEDVLAGKVPFRSHTGPSFQFTSERLALDPVPPGLSGRSEKGLKGRETCWSSTTRLVR
jgi:hypothetical protein